MAIGNRQCRYLLMVLISSGCGMRDFSGLRYSAGPSFGFPELVDNSPDELNALKEIV
jgi:hypothetical protein